MPQDRRYARIKHEHVAEEITDLDDALDERLTDTDAAFSISNAVDSRGYDADATTVAELADTLATVIVELQNRNILN